MKNTSVLFYTLFFTFHIVFAQKESFKFEKESHNFGTIEENGGSVTHKFEFTNVGSEPIKIKKVKASCGCTTPSWSKDAIAPGEVGFVTAKYNPKNRPGKFNKSLTITTQNDERILLRINGNVSKAELPPEQKFPYLSGNLRFKNEEIHIGNVLHDKIKTVEIQIYNVLDKNIALLSNVKTPQHITLSMKKDTLNGEKHTNITLSFDATAVNDWGKHIDFITFNIDGAESKVRIASSIVENFGNLSEDEKEFAPKITLSKSSLNFGNVSKGKKVKSTITYVNNGKNNLIIRKVSSTCGCTVVKSKNNEIKPGKSGKLIITLNTAEEDFNQNNIITLICNDPVSPVHEIQVRANITE